MNKYKYLGVTVSGDGTGVAREEVIFKANQWWGRLCAMAKFRSNRYEVVKEDPH